MQAQSPQLVGIVGGSCAGKTWLAERLQGFFGEAATRLSLDNFYLDQSHLSPARRAQINFDRPQAIDWERVESVLADLSKGQTTSVPRYNFATHGRQRDELLLSPAPIVIVEGLWLFRRPSVRKVFHLKIFIRSSAELCTERRIQRDTVERGRTPEQVREQLRRYTLPMFERFVAPQEKWADVALDAPVREEDVETIVKRIEMEQTEAVGI